MRFSLLFCLCGVLWTTGTLAQSTGAPPAPGVPLTEEDAQIVLKLAQVQKDFEARKKDVITMALGRYSSAAQSEFAAAQYYVECQALVQSRTPDLDGVTTKDVKDKSKQQLDSLENAPGRAAILQLQLQYLVFMIEAPKMKDRGAMVARLRDFAAKGIELVKAYSAPAPPEHKPVASVKTKGKKTDPREQQQDDRARRQLVRSATQGVMGSIFAQAYNLQNYFKPMDGWPQSPLDLNGIYTGMLMPFYREQKKDMLGSIWDEYIANQALLERCSNDDKGYGNWLIGAGRTLQWQKWKDLLANGKNRVAAADELVKLCKENATHPEVGAWVQELAQLMEQVRTGTLPIPAPAAPPPPQ